MAADTRRAAISEVDAALGRLLSNVPADVAVLVAGIADSAPSKPPGDEEPGTIAPSALRVALRRVLNHMASSTDQTG